MNGGRLNSCLDVCLSNPDTLSLMKHFLLLALLAISLHAQTTPDVSQPFSFTTAANGPTQINTTGGPQGTSTWALTWSVVGFTAAEIHLQGSQDNATFADITTTALILEGANPTSWTSATTSNRMVVRSYLPYIRVRVDTLTGSGMVNTLLLGYKGSNATPIGTGGGGGGGGTGPGGSTLVAWLCPSTAEVALSGTGYTQIVAGSGSTVIYVCKLLVTSSSAGSPTVNTFTAAFGTCGSSPTEVFNAAGITGLDSDFGGSLASGAGGALCLKESVAQSDKVTVTYYQH